MYSRAGKRFNKCSPPESLEKETTLKCVDRSSIFDNSHHEEIASSFKRNANAIFPKAFNNHHDKHQNAIFPSCGKTNGANIATKTSRSSHQSITTSSTGTSTEGMFQNKSRKHDDKLKRRCSVKKVDETTKRVRFVRNRKLGKNSTSSRTTLANSKCGMRKQECLAPSSSTNKRFSISEQYPKAQKRQPSSNEKWRDAGRVATNTPTVKRRPTISNRWRKYGNMTTNNPNRNNRSNCKYTLWLAIAFVSVLLIACGIVYSTYSDSRVSVAGGRNYGTIKPPPPLTGSSKGPGKPSKYSSDEWDKLRGKCGSPETKPNISQAGRIVGGGEARQHSWPWQIALIKFKMYGDGRASVKHYCGGTLIQPRYVVTATHCFMKGPVGDTTIITDLDVFRVVVGAHKKEAPGESGKLVKISGIFHHPDNNLATFQLFRKLPTSDLTLLQLATEVDVQDPTTSLACLPNFNIQPLLTSECVATGWGLTMNTGFDDVLKQASLNLISEQKCRKTWSDKISYHNHLCVDHKYYGESQGTCKGDSGGPLVCRDPTGKWTVYGATSFGHGSCKGVDAVFVNIAFYVEWLCCYMKTYELCGNVECSY